MTQLLEQALLEVEKLSAPEQDANRGYHFGRNCRPATMGESLRALRGSTHAVGRESARRYPGRTSQEHRRGRIVSP